MHVALADYHCHWLICKRQVLTWHECTTPSRHHSLQVTNIIKYSHEVYTKHIIQEFSCSAVWTQHDWDELVLIRDCSRIHMMEVQEMQKGGSSLFQSWAFHVEMLLALCCMTCMHTLSSTGRLMYIYQFLALLTMQSHRWHWVRCC